MASPLNKTIDRYVSMYRPNQITTFDLREPCRSDNKVNFYSNDYLSLATNPQLRDIFLKKLGSREYIMGSRGSRLGGGNNDEQARLEERLASFFRGPSALLFSSGFDANAGVWSTLPQRGDVIVYDEGIHTSIHTGIRASKARQNLFPFSHNSIPDLRLKLQKVLKLNKGIRNGTSSVFVLTEALYSFDADFAPLREILESINQILPPGVGHLFVDEAHSTGIVGDAGEGLTAVLGLNNEPNVSRLHTFGKAMGCSGAVLICPESIRQFLIYFCRHFIFTTAMPIFNLLAMDSVIDYLESELGLETIQRRKATVEYARSKLVASLRDVPAQIAYFVDTPAHYAPGDFPSPIIPIITPFAQNLAICLKGHGEETRQAMFPIVPIGKECVRLSFHANHSKESIDRIVGIISDWARETAEANPDAPPVIVVDPKKDRMDYVKVQLMLRKMGKSGTPLEVLYMMFSALPYATMISWLLLVFLLLVLSKTMYHHLELSL